MSGDKTNSCSIPLLVLKVVQLISPSGRSSRNKRERRWSFLNKFNNSQNYAFITQTDYCRYFFSSQSSDTGDAGSSPVLRQFLIKTFGQLGLAALFQLLHFDNIKAMKLDKT